MKKVDDLLWLDDNVCYCKEALVILSEDTATVFDEKDIDPQVVSGYRLAPWGVDNDLPQKVMDKIDKAEIVGSNAGFNWKVAYGLGPRLMEVIRDPETNEVVKKKLVIEGPAYDWYTRNNIPLLLMEIMTDMSYFGNAFPVLIADPETRTISGIRHREAMFSRWGITQKGLINKHLYCGKWDENPSRNDIQESYVVDEFNAVEDIAKRLVLGKDKRLCYPIYLPSPGRPYYSYPTWWSIFRSGWFDHLTSIPGLKRAILKYNLGVKHIIYISESYFDEKEEMMKIAKTDVEARKKLREDVVKQISNVLAGEENAGRSITAMKKMMPSGNGMAMDKQIEIETIKNDISGGEYLTDYETGANIISYAMEVHPSLIGATPGKNSNSLSGSNIREIFIMKQSMSKPNAYLALQWWPVVRTINKWNPNLEIVMQDSLFTTLDQSKSGEVRTENTPAQ